MSYRLGILVSHPIQYYAPWFRYLSERMDVEVFYAHLQDAKGQADAGFGVEFEWDVPLLEGYPYRWLTNVARQPGLGTFNGLDTPELYDIVQSGRFDAFLLFGWNRKAYWQAMRACRKARIPILMRGDSNLGTTRSFLISVGKYIPYRSFLPRINGHLYVGQQNKAYLKHYGIPEEQLFFSPHFVDSGFFARRAYEAKTGGKAAALRLELGIAGDAFVCLFVGKMLQVKRPNDLTQAICRHSSLQSSATHAVFVGDGPLRSQLEEEAKKRSDLIHFAGFRNQNELPGFYQMANALVLPSEAETWGLVVNEAQACGLPAIVSNTVGCAPDLIDEGETGFTFQSGNVDELGYQIANLKVLCSTQQARIVDALKKKAAAYSMEAATEGLQAAIQSISGHERMLKPENKPVVRSAV